ncbi:MAG TPA: cation:proton antiporter [Thermoanaerobaculia bacterium]|nr:cation:proton antiporter [Thermoanaerobaculia bacterium]
MSIHDFLRDAVILLAASTAAVLACHKLRTPAVVGFLLTGMLIGPAGLALIPEVERVTLFAEIGVVFLLFTIGLEFSLERLKEIRRFFLVGGSLQSFLTIGAAAGIAIAAGMRPAPSIFLGFLLALSSTAIVLKLYADRRELDAPQGKLLIGVLLFQDFLIVPMIVLTPVLAGRVEASLQSVLLRFLISLAVVAGVFVLARYLMPKLLHLIVRTQVREVLVLGALLICLGMAWFTESLRFSLALGAFLAGIIISESEYSHQIVAEVVPFRDVFNSIFFISIGMLLDLGFAAERAGLIAGLALLIVGVKALAAAGAGAALGLSSRVALIGGLSLAQIGEFSFVLLQVGQQNGVLPTPFFQTFIAASVLTMMATPLLVAAAPWLAERIPRLRLAGLGQAASSELRDHVVIVGYGVNGRNLSRVLREASIPYRVIELNPELGRTARLSGEPLLYGDATRREILEHAGIRTARVVVFAISDLIAVRRSIRLARELHPGINIVVRTRAVAEIEGLQGCGANEVIAEEFETSIEIFTRVLRQYHVPSNIIRAQTRALRGEDYQMLRVPARDRQLSESLLRILAQGITDVYMLSPAHLRRAGDSIRALALRERTGATVIAVVRGQKSHTNPPPDLELQDGDCLVLVGSHGEIERAFDFLDHAAAEGEARPSLAEPA